MPENWPTSRRIPASSLSSPVGDDSELGDLLGEDDPTPDELHQRELRDRIDAALSRMERRDRLVLTLRYGLHGGHTYTLAEVGRVLCVTRERVRQIQIRAERRLAQRLAG